MQYLVLALLVLIGPISTLPSQELGLPKRVVLRGPEGQFFEELKIDGTREHFTLVASSQRWFGPINPYTKRLEVREISQGRKRLTFSEGYFIGEKTEIQPFIQVYDPKWRFGGGEDDSGILHLTSRNGQMISSYDPTVFPFMFLWDFLFVSGKVDVLEYFIYSNGFNYDFFPVVPVPIELQFTKTGKGDMSFARLYDHKILGFLQLDEQDRITRFSTSDKNGQFFIVTYEGDLVAEVQRFRFSFSEENRTLTTRFFYKDGNVYRTVEVDRLGKIYREWVLSW